MYTNEYLHVGYRCFIVAHTKISPIIPFQTAFIDSLLVATRVPTTMNTFFVVVVNCVPK